MLRNRLFWGFAALVILFAVVSAFSSVSIIKDRVVAEAQTRVRLDLNAARSTIEAKLSEIEIVLRLAASKEVVVDSCVNEDWSDESLRNRLEVIRTNLGLDFLTMVSADGRVVLRSSQPYATGDFKMGLSPVRRALDGETVTSIELFSSFEMDLEDPSLSERAFLVLEPTPYARPSARTEETRGMLFMSATPIKKNGQVLGALYGGVLMNKDTRLVDTIQETVFPGETSQEKPVGAVTIFLHDTRIATTVRMPNGNRAVGTRVSKDVADKVLDNGHTWEGRAFVVKDWYITAYEPVFDSDLRVIGMLYMGLLEEPFTGLIRETIIRYVLISIVGMVFSLFLAFFLSAKIAGPLHRLAGAAKKLNTGSFPDPVSDVQAATETRTLIHAFNDMVVTLKEREDNLREANEKLEQVNKSLRDLNHDYMETVGFISHELKSPLSTIMNYLFLLSEEKLGPLTDKQRKGLKSIDMNVKRLVEMVRHYLNLSRIENGVLNPIPTTVQIHADVVLPLLESYFPQADEKFIIIENDISKEITTQTDLNMTREVFENLISNAIKYGKKGGWLRLWAEDAGSFWKFHVYNSSDGIPEEKIALLFQKFSRIEDDPAARDQKGTGLGLFITKHIIETHGGTIDIDSQQGVGVDFIFTLPKGGEGVRSGA